MTLKNDVKGVIPAPGSVISVLVLFAIAPLVGAVVPPPEGGYPGFNTVEGTNALKNLSTGVGNAAIGRYSLFSNTDGSFNTAVGAGTLLFNVGDQSTGEGTQNTAVGAAALLFNTTGIFNTAIGSAALNSNITSSENTAVGINALQQNTEGSFNTATGEGALINNTEGSANTACGLDALFSNVNGGYDTAIGSNALGANTAGDENTAIGVTHSLPIPAATITLHWASARAKALPRPVTLSASAPTSLASTWTTAVLSATFATLL